MTPAPTADELASRYIFDPAEGSIHIHDLINMAKDGIYVKDRVSDHVIGMLVHAKDIGEISGWHGTLFQLPFIKGMKLRSSYAHIGSPFLGPDGLVLTLCGRTLHGSTGDDINNSPLTKDTITTHANYAVWLKDTLYAGGSKTDRSYARVRTNNNLKDCDTYVNSVPYTPGPDSYDPDHDPDSDSGNAPGPSGKKKSSTPRKKKTKKTKSSKSSKSSKASEAKTTSPANSSTPRNSAVTLRVGKRAPEPAKKGKKNKAVLSEEEEEVEVDFEEEPEVDVPEEELLPGDGAPAGVECAGEGQDITGFYDNGAQSSGLSLPLASDAEGCVHHPTAGGKTVGPALQSDDESEHDEAASDGNSNADNTDDADDTGGENTHLPVIADTADFLTNLPGEVTTPGAGGGYAADETASDDAGGSGASGDEATIDPAPEPSKKAKKKKAARVSTDDEDYDPSPSSKKKKKSKTDAAGGSRGGKTGGAKPHGRSSN